MIENKLEPKQMEKLDISMLLVEDDKVIRHIYAHILEKHVSKLFIAVDGEDGYNSYLKNNPDLILTDIKMPVMNGLDMIKKIRENDKTMRIIIMSAYSESRFFLKAIETGVKGFLVKPVAAKHLLSVINEQANDILLEKRLDEEAAKRQSAERERDKGEDILRALSQATATFFSQGVNDSTVNNVLKLIGERADVSRSYIFKLHNTNGERHISHIHEWAAQGVVQQINNNSLKNIPTNDPPFKAWEAQMSNHQNISGIVKDFDEPIRTILAQQDICSILAIPIFVKNIWWGFIGFDDCISERIWTDAEINALEMLAFNLGGAIYRREVEEEMTRLNASLEERVWERTKDLEQEVAERTIAESLLRDSEEKYRLIYENANDGIILIMNNVISLVNPKMAEIIGSLPKNIIGKYPSSLVKPEYVKEVDNYFKNDGAASTDDRNEMQVQMLNGKWLELRATGISWDFRPATLVFISDITKRKKAEKELHELNRNLEKRIKEEIGRVNAQQQLLVQKSKIESIGELSAGLAHEINQPLGGISMGLENILINANEDGVDEEYIRKKVNVLFEDIDRIRKIIEHVRLFSRDQDNSAIEAFSVNEVVSNALSLVSKQFTGRHIELATNMPDVRVETFGNQYRLEQVLLNLLSNARYAVDEKAKQAAPDKYVKRISMDLTKNSSGATITITDNGIGINKDIVPKIFDPFFTTKSEEKGTGLGLSISYGIISEMQGVIEVESEESKFTRVMIKIPNM